MSHLLEEVRRFAVEAFDILDANGNGFISRDELKIALHREGLDARHKSYVKFLLANIEKISRAYDDGDSIKPCGISRNDIAGISRADIVSYFGSGS